MARLSFSKASLHKESAQLKRFKKYLPSLNLKRQQLIAERTKAIAQLAKTEEQIQSCYAIITEQIPMLSDEHIDLDGLVTIKKAVIGEENLVGIKLPVLEQIEIQCQPYSYLTKPHWVDLVVRQLKEMLDLKIRLTVNQQRLEISQQAVKKSDSKS